MLTPRQKSPALSVPTLDDTGFDIAETRPRWGTLICFYRGLHCPLCATYLTELESLSTGFASRGVDTIAVSADTRERAQGMADKVGAGTLRFGYGLPLSVAREWGLYLSGSRGKTSIGIDEPPVFSEPGLFLVNADQTIYYVSVQSMPFVRPHCRELLGAIDFAIEKNYPARGEYTGPV